MAKACDVLVVGAGPVGAIAARLLAEKDLKILVIDKRGHIAGNCYDEIDPYGVLIHKYGPHYFRTNSDELMRFLTRFSDWIPGTYIVKNQIGNTLYPFPINLDTLESFFHIKLDEESGQRFLKSLQQKFDWGGPRNSEEFVLSRVGRVLYENFYLGYTLKQWEMHPKDLDPSVCGRIPVRFNRYDRYVDDKFQVLPKHGYSQLFNNVLTHPNIELQLSTDYLQYRKDFKPARATLYCGPVDQYFEEKLGALPWRSLRFEFININKEFVQPCVQINYPDISTPYNRSIEIKHATGQQCPSTTISYEYSLAQSDPYYPVPNPGSRTLYEKYKELTEVETQKKQIYFAGRLAEYTYINTDQAIERGLEVGQQIWDDLNARK